MNTRNKSLIIVGCVLLGLAVAIFLIGGAIAGWDFVAFFKSQTFIWICVLVGLYALAVIAILVLEKIKKL